MTGGKLARHSSVASSHRNANAQPTGRLPGGGSAAREPDDPLVDLDVRRGGGEVPGVRVLRRGEDLRRRALLDDPPGVHHGDPVGEVGDDRQIVRDVQRGDAVLGG